MHSVGASSYSSGDLDRTFNTRSVDLPGICAQASVNVPPLSMAIRIPVAAISSSESLLLRVKDYRFAFSLRKQLLYHLDW